MLPVAGLGGHNMAQCQPGEGMFVQVVCWACSHERDLCWEMLIRSDKCCSVCLGLRALLLGILGVGERGRSLLPFPVCATLGWSTFQGPKLKVLCEGNGGHHVSPQFCYKHSCSGLVLSWSLFPQVIMWSVGGMSPPSLSSYMLPSAALPFCAFDPREMVSQPSLTP